MNHLFGIGLLKLVQDQLPILRPLAVIAYGRVIEGFEMGLNDLVGGTHRNKVVHSCYRRLSEYTRVLQ